MKPTTKPARPDPWQHGLDPWVRLERLKANQTTTPQRPLRPEGQNTMITNTKRQVIPPARPKVASTKAERARLLDARPDLTAEQRKRLDRPDMPLSALSNLLTMIPKGPVVRTELDDELDQAMGIKSGGSPIRRGATYTEFGTMSAEQADEFLKSRGRR